MRRMGICEERGSGSTRWCSRPELFQLPLPLLEVTGESTRARALRRQPRPLTKMDKEDRVPGLLPARVPQVREPRAPGRTRPVSRRFGIGAAEHCNCFTAESRRPLTPGVIAPVDPSRPRATAGYVPMVGGPVGMDDKGEK